MVTATEAVKVTQTTLYLGLPNTSISLGRPPDDDGECTKPVTPCHLFVTLALTAAIAGTSESSK